MADNFYKKNENDKIWWVENQDRIGETLFTFDKEKIFNLFKDYPHELTKEQKEIFDKENPYWVNFFKDRSEENGGEAEETNARSADSIARELAEQLDSYFNFVLDSPLAGRAAGMMMYDAAMFLLHSDDKANKIEGIFKCYTDPDFVRENLGRVMDRKVYDYWRTKVPGFMMRLGADRTAISFNNGLAKMLDGLDITMDAPLSELAELLKNNPRTDIELEKNNQQLKQWNEKLASIKNDEERARYFKDHQDEFFKMQKGGDELLNKTFDEMHEAYLKLEKDTLKTDKKIDLAIVDETIEDLKNNPEACTIIGGTTLANGAYAIPESKPGEKLKKFIHYLGENNLLDQNYLENSKLSESKDIQDLSLDEALTQLTFIIRGDRFSSGLLKSKVDDGTMLQLIEKIKERADQYQIRKEQKMDGKKRFKNQFIGYGFKLDPGFRELTPEERQKYNIGNNITTYLVNESQGLEIMVSFDGFYRENNLDEFYKVCKHNMMNHGFQVVNEEKIISAIGLRKEACKLLVKAPNGQLQVSYFMVLTDLTERGYGLGCITANPRQDHDIVENYIVEMINNWEYIK